MAWATTPLLLYRRFIIVSGAKEISVFVDESGSYDLNASSSRFYIVCMVFHDQSALDAEPQRYEEFDRFLAKDGS